MQLVAEEVITVLPTGADFEIDFIARADCITLRLTCHSHGMDLAAFNLAFRPDLTADAEGLGLALASRYVDSFSLQADVGGRLHLLFSINPVFERPVPLPEAQAAWRFYRLVKPTAETMAAVGARLWHRALAGGKSARAFHPDRLSALVTAGMLFGTLAETETGEISGAYFCIPRDQRMLEGFGPFVFSAHDRHRMARDLACHTLERVARKPFSGVLTTCFDADCFPAEFYIPIRQHHQTKRQRHHRSLQAPAWHFPLSDDTGGALYYHAAAKWSPRSAWPLPDG